MVRQQGIRRKIFLPDGLGPQIAQRAGQSGQSLCAADPKPAIWRNGHPSEGANPRLRGRVEDAGARRLGILPGKFHQPLGKQKQNAALPDRHEIPGRGTGGPGGRDFRHGMQLPDMVFILHQPLGDHGPALARRAGADAAEVAGGGGKVAHGITIQFGGQRGCQTGGDEFALRGEARGIEAGLR